jgi:NADH-quinone oxidoreductase subunit H
VASIFLIMLIRWTLPRFRFDQLMELSWKVFIPLSLANVVIVMTVLQFKWRPWTLTVLSLGLFLVAGIIAAGAKRYDIRNRRRASLAMT